MDLISIEMAIETIDRFNACGYVEEPYENLRDALQELPATVHDFVPCADCCYADNKKTAAGLYWCTYHDDYMKYCSDAKRREG